MIAIYYSTTSIFYRHYANHKPYVLTCTLSWLELESELWHGSGRITISLKTIVVQAGLGWVGSKISAQTSGSGLEYGGLSKKNEPMDNSGSTSRKHVIVAPGSLLGCSRSSLKPRWCLPGQRRYVRQIDTSWISRLHEYWNDCTLTILFKNFRRRLVSGRELTDPVLTLHVLEELTDKLRSELSASAAEWALVELI